MSDWEMFGGPLDGRTWGEPNSTVRMLAVPEYEGGVGRGAKITMHYYRFFRPANGTTGPSFWSYSGTNESLVDDFPVFGPPDSTGEYTNP